MFDFNFDTDLRVMKSNAGKNSLSNLNPHSKIQCQFCRSSVKTIRRFQFLSRFTRSFHRFVFEHHFWIYMDEMYMVDVHHIVNCGPFFKNTKIDFTAGYFCVRGLWFLSGFESCVSFICILILKYHVFILQTDMLF